ncbi:MAG: FAD-dependent oxidoreductase [Henriciella sp.]|uniref:NAD(P)/FAD-dependent oxidoreductase n=1 Tax=Henriciella sp. TaxID=1968823 RepID=UPI003C74DF53
MKIAIIGAGMAGLAAARPLTAAGHHIRLFDKGRGPGGRLSTRRAETSLGECRWDHGAQYFTARGEAFRTTIETLLAEGSVREWTPRLATIKAAGTSWLVETEPPREGGDAIYVGAPAMNSVIKALAEGLDIEWGRRVSAIEPGPDGKTLIFEDGSREGLFDIVISAIPAEQAGDLLESAAPGLAEQAERTRSAPCWAVMLAFEHKVPVDWDGAKIEGAPLSWVARNSAKPGRGGIDSWVLHASPEWSKANVELGRDEVTDQLTTVFRDMTGAPAPVFKAAHRWLLAMVEQAAGSPFGWDSETGIATIGDWRIAPRVEAAWQSGHSLAAFLLR